MLQPNPLAPEDALEGAVVLKGNDQADHRRVAKDEQVNEAREKDQQ